MLGQAEPLQIDIDALEQRLERPDHARIRASMTELGLGSAVELLATYSGRFFELKSWLASAEINRDRTLRLQYLAGLQLNSSTGAATYREMIDRREFPADLFIATPSRLAELKRALDLAAKKPPPP